jgi:hypothetical protein
MGPKETKCYQISPSLTWVAMRFRSRALTTRTGRAGNGGYGAAD